jgi:hypothetical protein
LLLLVTSYLYQTFPLKGAKEPLSSIQDYQGVKDLVIKTTVISSSLPQ